MPAGCRREHLIISSLVVLPGGCRGLREDTLLVLVGDDWAEDHHDVEVQDEAGRRLGKAKLEEGIEGIARLHALIGEHAGEDDEPHVVVGSRPTAVRGFRR